MGTRLKHLAPGVRFVFMEDVLKLNQVPVYVVVSSNRTICTLHGVINSFSEDDEIMDELVARLDF